MKKYIIFVTLLVILSGTILSQSTPSGTIVTATLKNVNVSPQSKDTFIRFELQNYGNFVPKVLGSYNIVPSHVDLYPDVNGLVTGTIVGNDIITPTNTYYHVCYYSRGIKYFSDTKPFIMNHYTRLNNLTNIRYWVGTTSVLSIAFDMEDDITPDAVQDVIMFRFSTSAGDAHYKCVFRNNAGAVLVTDSG